MTHVLTFVPCVLTAFVHRRLSVCADETTVSSMLFLLIANMCVILWGSVATFTSNINVVVCYTRGSFFVWKGYNKDGNRNKDWGRQRPVKRGQISSWWYVEQIELGYLNLFIQRTMTRGECLFVSCFVIEMLNC